MWIVLRVEMLFALCIGMWFAVGVRAGGQWQLLQMWYVKQSLWCGMMVLRGAIVP